MVILLLIQIGGLGVSTIGAGLILALGRKINLWSVNIVKEGSNLNSRKGIRTFVRDIFLTTLIIEFVGAVLTFVVFIQYMDFWTAMGVSIFHSIASFNNSGFDVFGCLGSSYEFQSLIPYQNNVYLNLITSALIILGGLGFLVIRDLLSKNFRWKKLSMHSKVVLSTSLALIVFGTLLLKLSEGSEISWLGAFFFSVSARTAGFATFSVNSFSVAGLLVLIVLMFIGASPGSTGGGIKTTTFFALIQGVKSATLNKPEQAFKYAMPKDAFKKASLIVLLAISIVVLSSIAVALFEPQLSLSSILFEMTSAYGTVGLTTGITENLGVGSKLVSIIVMYIGRLGPLTVATIWSRNKKSSFTYPEGNVAIG